MNINLESVDKNTKYLIFGFVHEHEKELSLMIKTNQSQMKLFILFYIFIIIQNILQNMEMQ